MEFISGPLNKYVARKNVDTGKSMAYCCTESFNFSKLFSSLGHFASALKKQGGEKCSFNPFRGEKSTKAICDWDFNSVDDFYK